MYNYKKYLLLISAVVIQSSTIAQKNISADADINKGMMESGGKIYVVMAIVLTILSGLIGYVSRIDRKITKLEKGESL